jgi:hypothetical protein
VRKTSSNPVNNWENQEKLLTLIIKHEMEQKMAEKRQIQPRPTNYFALKHTKMGTQANIPIEKGYMNTANTTKKCKPHRNNS